MLLFGVVALAVSLGVHGLLGNLDAFFDDDDDKEHQATVIEVRERQKKPPPPPPPPELPKPPAVPEPKLEAAAWLLYAVPVMALFLVGARRRTTTPTTPAAPSRAAV